MLDHNHAQLSYYSALNSVITTNVLVGIAFGKDGKMILYTIRIREECRQIDLELSIAEDCIVFFNRFKLVLD